MGTNTTPTTSLTFKEIDDANNPRGETTDFERLTEKALSRRAFVGGGLAFGLGAFVMGSTALSGPAMASSRLGFKAVAANALDTITVPEGYGWHIVAAWGDPMWSDAPEFDPETRGTGASQEPSATTTTAWRCSSCR